MAHKIQCRLCKVYFDTEKEPFVLVGKKSYYHQKCYEDWITKRNDPKAELENEFWYENVIDYLYRDVKMSIDFSKLKSQWANFTKPEKKMTPKGIFFTLKYYYDVMKGDKEKALGGIGIVQSIYSDSARYWYDLEERKSGTIDAIIAQIKERQDRKVVVMNRPEEKKKDKARYTFDDV